MYRSVCVGFRYTEVDRWSPSRDTRTSRKAILPSFSLSMVNWILTLSPIIANLFMEHLEEEAIQSAPFQPAVWTRSVDDTFIIWQHGEEELARFHQHLNQQSPNIQFTMAEHKYAVRRGDERNGIAVHVHQLQHSIDWESARVRLTAPGYWNRRTLEAIQIRSEQRTMNLDCGLHISPIWNPLLDAT